ncbi:hypothetical protein PM082_016343 [Marasmius tenuissimus]|nr:hypothetical protein PM082_016343 [Marasmius tenuissimus]
MSDVLPALSLSNSNLWNLPNVKLSAAEADEDQDLRGILEQFEPVQSSNATPESPYYLFHLSHLLLRNDHHRLQLDNVRLLVSSTTQRLIFIRRNDAHMLFQKRLSHVEKLSDIQQLIRGELILNICPNPFIRNDHDINLSLEDIEERKCDRASSSVAQRALLTSPLVNRFQAIVEELFTTRVEQQTVIPEVLDWNEAHSHQSETTPSDFAPVSHFEILKHIQETFSDIAYGDGSQVFAIIGSAFDYNRALQHPRQMGEKVRKSLRHSGIPRILISHHDGPYTTSKLDLRGRDI